ncbi:MAG TPA: elongation factor 4 [Candidatus Aerophobetes bacterium]|uniref:Elongation factor 4 n=1 Tax=Aerophobetes bacterium TaxID=2030807 RepID=A0A7V5HZT5_UNCAE|nr:elongation factor 4 [Candidatus Aerophobetes bacterium]
MSQKNIRNFSIIAHIDHGKSTLADRLLEYTHTLSPRELREQTLDTMDLEREKGITIKAHTITLSYRTKDGKDYTLNLIDTPGHVDFSYEVSRALFACEGALLLVDATQGVEAQTVANFHLARERNLVIIPVINKIDLPLANPERVKSQLKKLGVCKDSSEVILASAREGKGVPEILEAIVKKIPPPPGANHLPLKALIFDSFFDNHRGVIAYIRVFEGVIKPGMKIIIMSSGKEFKVEEVGILKLKRYPKESLESGQVGYLIANVKNISDLRVGDTVTEKDNPTSKPFPGYKEPKPVVFCGIYPAEGETFERLKNALNKLRLNDPSFTFRPENSPVLGPGFHCGFLGLLHKEIVQERLEREFDLNLITTAPNVAYRVLTSDGEVREIDNPAKFPSNKKIEAVEEPFIKANIITQKEYMGAVFELLERKRGKFLDMKWLDTSRVLLTYNVPLGEVATKFYDELKSVTRGYATFDYEHAGYKEADLVKLEVLVNGKLLDALSVIVHKEKAYLKARYLAKKLKELIPRHQFAVPIQVAIGSRIIARETIPALRKDVTAPLYGGDVTRKKKLLERQKEGKKRMKRFGSVNVPQEAFMAIMEEEK